MLIVAGGVLLVGERDRPEHVRVLGLVLALGGDARVLGARQPSPLARRSTPTSSPGPAAAATLAAGGALIAGYVLVRRLPLRRSEARAFVPAGLLFGASYICLFEAYYRGPVTVVSPLVATESLWGVVLSALVLGRSERIGVRLAAGAVLVVSGGILIGSFR